MAPNKLTHCHCVAFTVYVHIATCNTCVHSSLEPHPFIPLKQQKPVGNWSAFCRHPLLFFSVRCTSCMQQLCGKCSPKNKNQKAAANKMQNAQKRKSARARERGKFPGCRNVPLAISLSLSHLWHAVRCTAAFKMVWQSFFHIIDCLLD